VDPERIEALIERGNDSYEARLAAGQAWSRRGQPKRAVEHLRRACDQGPDKTAAWQALGLAQRQLGDLDGAIEAWRRGIKVAGSNGDQQAEKVMRVWLKRLER